MNVMRFLYSSLAVYYLATAFVDVMWLLDKWYVRVHASRTTKFYLKFGKLYAILAGKPFNCVMCMSFYIAIVVVAANTLVPFVIIVVPAVAGVALLLHKIHGRLETLVI